MNWIITLYTAVLFFLLTPGVILSLPPKGGLYTVAAVHAIVFALVFHFTHNALGKLYKGGHVVGSGSH